MNNDGVIKRVVAAVQDALAKAFGEGQGVGNEPQGTGGTDTCVCPVCGAEKAHDRGTPCNEEKCPKCGVAMVGKEEKSAVAIEKPYDTLESLPDAVKKLPKHGQEIYRAAFNAAYAEYGEQRAHAIAWAAVKSQYEQQDGKWVAKAIHWFRFSDHGETVTASPDDVWFQFSTYPTAPWVQLDRFVPFIKVDDKRLVYMVVMEPGDPEHLDTQGDFTKAEEIEEACHHFMGNYRLGKAGLGLQHDRVLEGHIKESYIAPQDLEIGGNPVAKGSWVMVAYVAEEDVWKSVKSGELTGASIGGVGERVAA